LGVSLAFVNFDPPTPTGTADAELLALELSDSPTRRTPARSTDRSNVICNTDQLNDPLPVPDGLPGSDGEHLLQNAFGTSTRAERFYADQHLDELNERMIEFMRRMDLAFVATSDAAGECDCSLRAGPAGFIQVLDRRTVAYPEYRGNGVLASLGNISENPRVGILMVDFVRDLIGLHVNGDAHVVEDADLRARYPDLTVDDERGRTPERWVVVRVTEAYIHCRKHIPRLVPVESRRQWGTDDPIPKGGDYFGAKQTAADRRATPYVSTRR
jgi:predicted pyridoxine 5'-phosphate oxidase superfamily flavin-nucleotide-binding protein